MMLALLLVVFAICPPVANICARLLGIYSTPNFLFLFTIFLLMAKVFSMTIHLSQIESKQKELIQKMALDQKEKEELELKVQELMDGKDRAAEVEDECEQ